MGKIPAGIMGGVKGKVGGVIGAVWHGISYIKTYVVPTNPNTPAQQTQRSKMVPTVLLGKIFLTTIIHPFWNPFASGMGGFHLFTRENLLNITNPADLSQIIMTKGDLLPIRQQGIPPGYYNLTNGLFRCYWNDIGGSGYDPNQLIGVAVYDMMNATGFVSVTPTVRAEEEKQFNIGAGRDFSQLYAWIFAYSGTGQTLEISNSVYFKPLDG